MTHSHAVAGRGPAQRPRQVPSASASLLRPAPWIVLAAALLTPTTALRAAEKVIPVGIQVDDTAFGNGDGSLEPGERATIKISLFNDGDVTATGITGTLSYDGSNPFVQILDGVASWPDLPPDSAPQFSDAPHLEVMLAASTPCSVPLSFLLDVQTVAGSTQHAIEIQPGRHEDRDAFQDPIRRFDEPETTLWGEDGALGAAVATGDVNGDGRADIVVAAPWATNWHGTYAGYVYVIYGLAVKLTNKDLAGPGTSMARFAGAAGGMPPAGPGVELGLGTATGDFNGDGYDDILLSSCGSDPNGPHSGTAEYYLIYGGAASLPDMDMASPPSNVATFWGVPGNEVWPPGSKNCSANVAAGDLNGDGYDDAILLAGVGQKARIVYGQSTPLSDIDLTSAPGVSLVSGFAKAIGYGGMAAGDINGDGYDDLAMVWVSAPGYGVSIVFGQAADLGFVDLDTSPPGVVDLTNTNLSLGDNDVLTNLYIGDLDSDGMDDLVVVNQISNSIGDTRANAGEYYLVYGKGSGWTGFDFQSPPPGVVRFYNADPSPGISLESYGLSATTGDLDGDGREDLVLTNPPAYSQDGLRAAVGRSHVLYGTGQRWEDLDLGSPPSGVSRIWGSDAQDRSGYALAAADVDGDGFDDLILGAPVADSINDSRPDAGEAYIWYGKPRHTYIARGAYGIPLPLYGASAQALSLNCDDCDVAVALPFDFPFYGETFNTLYISSNGFLSFAPINNGLPSYIPSCPGSPGYQKFLIAPLWTDLNPGAGGNVWFDVQGTAPFRRAVIEWQNVPHYPAIGGADFFAVLYETTGEILFSYWDLDFGDPAHDNGLSSVAGLINRTGAQGSAFSCFANDLLVSPIAPALQFLPATSLLEEHAEHGEGLWTMNGPWHADAICAPPAHSGAWSWYAGDSVTCTDGGVTSGELFFPTIPDFPADGRLRHWVRDGLDTSSDAAHLYLSTSGTGGPWVYLSSYNDNLEKWRPMNDFGNALFAYAGADVDMEFLWVHGSSGIDRLGFMVDDIQVTGCNAVGAGGPDDVVALAYGSPPYTYCQGTRASLLDAIGSICGDYGSPDLYSWFENQQLLISSSIPLRWISGMPAGTYTYDLVVHCIGGATAQAVPITYTILDHPPAVDAGLNVTGDATSLTFTWNAVPGATDYGIFQDSVAGGAFGTLTGTSSGAPSLNVSTPAGDLVYFLAGASNGCGFGPLNGLPPVCGNGIVEPPEECDDGGTTSGDGCSATCLWENVCGDGICIPIESSCTCPADCGAPPAEICSDGLDNDCDGDVDCADADCSADPNCAP